MILCASTMILDLALGLLARLLRVVFFCWLPLASFELSFGEGGTLVAKDCVVDCVKLNELLESSHCEYVEFFVERIDLRLSWEALLKNGLQISCSGMRLKISENEHAVRRASNVAVEPCSANDQPLADAARALVAGYNSALLGRIEVSCGSGSIEMALSQGSNLAVSFSSLNVQCIAGRRDGEEEEVEEEEMPNQTSARLLSHRSRAVPPNVTREGSSVAGEPAVTRVAASCLVLSVASVGQGGQPLLGATFESATFSATGGSVLVDLGVARAHCHCLAGAAEALGGAAILLCGGPPAGDQFDGFYTQREDSQDALSPRQGSDAEDCTPQWRAVVCVAGLDVTFGAEADEQGGLRVGVGPARLTVLPSAQDCYPPSATSVSFPSLAAECVYGGLPFRVCLTEGAIAGDKAECLLVAVEAASEGHAVRAEGQGLSLSWQGSDAGISSGVSASTIDLALGTVRLSERGDGEEENGSEGMASLVEVVGVDGCCGLRLLAVLREGRGGGQQSLSLALTLGAATVHPWREGEGGWPRWLSTAAGLVPPPSSGGQISSVTCSLARASLSSSRLPSLAASVSGACFALTLVPGVGFVNLFASAEEVEVLTGPREENMSGAVVPEGWLHVCASVGAGSGLRLSGASLDVLVPCEARGDGGGGEVREAVRLLVHAVCERAEAERDAEKEERGSQRWEEERESEDLGGASDEDGEGGIPLLPLRPALWSHEPQGPEKQNDDDDEVAEGTARWLQPSDREGGRGSSSSSAWSLPLTQEQAARWLVDTSRLQHLPHHFPSPAPPAATKDPASARVRLLADALRVHLYPPDYAGPTAAPPAHHLCLVLSRVDCLVSQPRPPTGPAFSAGLAFADLAVLLVAAGGGSKVVVHGHTAEGSEGAGSGSVDLERVERRAELRVALPPLRVWLCSEVLQAWSELAAALGSGGSGEGAGCAGGGLESLSLPLELVVALAPLLLVVDNAPSSAVFRYARLQEGRLLEYLHLLPLSAMRLQLLPTTRTLSFSIAAEPAGGRGGGGVSGNEAGAAEGWLWAPSSCSRVGGVRMVPSAEFLVDTVMGDWLKDIAAHQVPALVRGVVPSKLLLHLQTLSPSPLGDSASLVTRLGAARAVRGAGLALSQDAAQLVYLLARQVAAVLRDFAEEGEGGLSTALPMHPPQRSHGGVWGGPSSSPSRLPIYAAPGHARQPAGVQEGAVLLMGAVTQSVTRTLDAAMRLPARTAGGVGLTARQVVQVVPVLLVAPVAGLAEGVAQLSLGVRNGLDPGKRREEEERNARGRF